jgi:hypothetical protein
VKERELSSDNPSIASLHRRDHRREEDARHVFKIWQETERRRDRQADASRPQIRLGESALDRPRRAPQLKGAPVRLDGIGWEIDGRTLRLYLALAALWQIIEEPTIAKGDKDVVGIAAGLAV